MRVVVFGATSIIGQSVCLALTQQSIHVIAVSRRNAAEDFSCQKLLKLSPNYCTIVQFNVIQNSSEQLVEMLTNYEIDGVFLALPCTTRLNLSTKEQRNSQTSSIVFGQIIVNACRQICDQIRFFIFCTNRSPLMTMGISCRQYDEAAQVETLIRQTSLVSITCFIMLPVLFETLENILKPRRLSNNNYQMSLPCAYVPIDWMSGEDVGPIISEICKKYTEFYGKTCALSIGKMDAGFICEQFNYVLAPLRFTLAKIPFDEMRQWPGADALDWGNMFEFISRVDQQYNVAMTLKWNSSAQNLNTWLRSHRENLYNLLLSNKN